MEKRKPHCPLPIVHALTKEGKIHATESAIAGGDLLGFDFDGMVEVVMALTLADFYKSMTTYADHTVWQDIYSPMTRSGKVYLKLMVANKVSIVSFKEL